MSQANYFPAEQPGFAAPSTVDLADRLQPRRSPLLGETVLYTIAEQENSINGARRFPAIVVRTWSADCVNLQVIVDRYEEPILYRSSVLRRNKGNEKFGNFFEFAD
ncbi:MAG TPA: hypothetical protein VFS24_06360 [Steroidobacteraceae bacterium]|nr:hypothetical protein [Steroidobacteraceae bacterium]